MKKFFLTIFTIFLLSINVALALNLGEELPNISIRAFNIGNINLTDFKGKVVVIEWFNPYCPSGSKYYREGKIQKLQEEFVSKGVIWLTVSSTSKDHDEYIDDDKAEWLRKGKEIKSSFILDDASGELAKIFGAKTTPDIFIINSRGQLTYRGAVDNDWDFFSKPEEPKEFVKLALNELLEGKQVSIPRTPSYGCPVKY